MSCSTAFAFATFACSPFTFNLSPQDQPKTEFWPCVPGRIRSDIFGQHSSTPQCPMAWVHPIGCTLNRWPMAPRRLPETAGPQPLRPSGQEK